jgi:hypothetical protein
MAHVIFYLSEDFKSLRPLRSALALQRANGRRQELARSANASRFDIESRQAHLDIRGFLTVASHLALL